MVNGVLPNQEEDPRLQSPALADQPASITGPQNLLPSVAGGTVPNQATPAPVGTNESPAGGSKPAFDPTKDRGSPKEMMAKIGAIEIFNLLEKSSDVINPNLKRPAKQPSGDDTDVLKPGGPGLGPNLRAQEATGAALDPNLRAPAQKSPLEITVSEGASREQPEQQEATREQKDKIDEILTEVNGETPYKTMQDYRDEHLKQVKKLLNAHQIPQHKYKGIKEGWKNIFNVIPKEDMGMFLMDFGFRLMVAAENMEGLGSLGVAAGGALNAQQGRRQGALDRDLGILGQTEEYAQKAYGEQTKRISAEAAQTQAEAAKSRADTALGGYRGEKAWLLELGEAMGKTKEQIWGMFNKELSLKVRIEKAFTFIRDAQSDASLTQVDPILGKRYRDFTSEDFASWVDAVITQETDLADEMSARDKYK